MTSGYFAAASVVLLAAACARPAEPVATAAPGLRLPRQVVPDHYAMTITPDLAAATFAGEETIDVRVLEPTARIVLHAAEIAFGRVTVEAGGRTQTATVTLDETPQTAALSLGQPLSPGPARLSISYTGILNGQLRGLYLSEANGRRYAVSQLEATDARRMYPSFDEPSFKATFDISAVIDRADRAISNGVVVSDTPGPANGKHTLKFARTPKMSSYLVALVVGDFECVSGGADGIPIRICATPDKKALTRLALTYAEDLMRFYNTYFGIKYPYGKLDVVAVPDFSAGAMENTGAIFYRERSLLADEKQASLGVRKNIMGILSHEMAHQWFGNLVTMDWWNDIWLNEGFATWAETKPIKILKPEWHVDLDEVRGNLEAMDVDRLQTTRPIRNPADTPEQIGEAFDAIAYSKGGAILRMIEAWVGEEPFRKGINAYLEKYQYANAKAEDFWSTVAAATGQPVDRVMASFVTQPGVPVLEVATSCEGPAPVVTVTQTRYRELAIAASPGPAVSARASSWEIPVCLRGPAAAADAACQVIARPTEPISFSPCPWTVVNARGAGYYRAFYDPASLDRLLKNVPAIAGSERIMLASDIWAAVRAGRQDVDAFMRVAAALSVDRTSAVIEVIASPVGFIGGNLTTPANKSRYEAWVTRTFAPALAEVGWTPTPGETDDRRALRAALVGILGGAGADTGVRERSKALALREVTSPGSVDPTLRMVVTGLAARHGDQALYERFLAAHRSAKSPEDRQRYLVALGSFTTPDLITRTIRFALSPEVRTQDAGNLLSVVLAGPGGIGHGWPLVRDQWDAVTRKVDPFFGIMNLIASLGYACDAGVAKEIRSFFETHKAPGAERTLQQAIESVESCAALKQAQSPALERALAQF